MTGKSYNLYFFILISLTVHACMFLFCKWPFTEKDIPRESLVTIDLRNIPLSTEIKTTKMLSSYAPIIEQKKIENPIEAPSSFSEISLPKIDKSYDFHQIELFGEQIKNSKRRFSFPLFTPSFSKRASFKGNMGKKRETSSLSSSFGNVRGKATDLFHNYLRSVRECIEKKKYYPLSARELNIEGKVKVTFTLNSLGRLVAPVKILHSSGYSLLDRAAISCIKRASPFPPFPKGLNLKKLAISIDINFKLKGG